MSLNGELEFRPVSNVTFSIGGLGLTYTAVSYTHLDVYKRQA